MADLHVGGEGGDVEGHRGRFVGELRDHVERRGRDDVDAVGDVVAVVAGDDCQAIERQAAGVDEQLDAGARLRAAGDDERSDDRESGARAHQRKSTVPSGVGLKVSRAGTPKTTPTTTAPATTRTPATTTGAIQVRFFFGGAGGGAATSSGAATVAGGVTGGGGGRRAPCAPR